MANRATTATARKHILVVDDNRLLLRLLRTELETEGYAVATAPDGTRALAQVRSSPPDLVVLDLMLPDMDGFDVCRQIRQGFDTPILMLTARERDADRVHGLDLGADDYVTKPFGMEELLARIRAVLRRSSSHGPMPQRSLQCCALEVDFNTRTVAVNARDVGLTPREFAIIAELAASPGRVLPHEELLRRVWGRGATEQVDYLWVNVSRLRGKLRAGGADPDHVQTRPGIGYVFRCPKPA